MIYVRKITKGKSRTKGPAEQYDGYRVMHKGWVIDVVKAPRGWGTMPIRKPASEISLASPKGPYCSLHEAIAWAGFLIATHINKSPEKS